PLLAGVLNGQQVSIWVVCKGRDSLNGVCNLGDLIEAAVLVLCRMPHWIGLCDNATYAVMKHRGCVEQRVGYTDKVRKIVSQLRRIRQRIRGRSHQTHAVVAKGRLMAQWVSHRSCIPISIVVDRCCISHGIGYGERIAEHAVVSNGRGYCV